jgi:hypothetical protein
MLTKMGFAIVSDTARTEYQRLTVASLGLATNSNTHADSRGVGLDW